MRPLTKVIQASSEQPAWPGLGRLFWEHAERTDIPVLMAIMMLTAAMVVFFNLLADVAYAFLDPRIRYG